MLTLKSLLTVAAKCNIPASVLEQMKELAWGFTCVNKADIDEAIMENYIEFLQCPTVEIAICHPDCNTGDGVVLFPCSEFVINKITLEHYTNLLDPETFYAFMVLEANGDLTGVNAPFTCVWEFDTNVLQLESLSDCVLTVTYKVGVDPNIITTIKVIITDSAGCIAEKTCYFINGEIKCDADYILCPGNVDLEVEDYEPDPEEANLILTWERLAGDVINLVPWIDGTYSLVDWGDGTMNMSLSHTYADAGTYTFKVYNSTATIIEIRNTTGPSVYNIIDVAAIPDTVQSKLGFDTNSIVTLPAINFGLITGLQSIVISKNLLTSFPSLATNPLVKIVNVAQNDLDTATIDALLIQLDAHGLSNGAFYSTGQVTPAPPSGGGITAKNNLIAKGWIVLTD